MRHAVAALTLTALAGTAAGQTLTRIPVPAPGPGRFIEVAGLSGDGRLAVGTLHDPAIGTTAMKTYWLTLTVQAQQKPAGASRAVAASYDGSVVVGTLDTTPPTGFREENGVDTLVIAPCAACGFEPRDVDGGGSVIVGGFYVPLQEEEAALWTPTAFEPVKRLGANSFEVLFK